MPTRKIVKKPLIIRPISRKRLRPISIRRFRTPSATTSSSVTPKPGGVVEPSIARASNVAQIGPHISTIAEVAGWACATPNV